MLKFKRIQTDLMSVYENSTNPYNRVTNVAEYDYSVYDLDMTTVLNNLGWTAVKALACPSSYLAQRALLVRSVAEDGNVPVGKLILMSLTQFLILSKAGHPSIGSAAPKSLSDYLIMAMECTESSDWTRSGGNNQLLSLNNVIRQPFMGGLFNYYNLDGSQSEINPDNGFIDRTSRKRVSPDEGFFDLGYEGKISSFPYTGNLDVSPVPTIPTNPVIDMTQVVRVEFITSKYNESLTYCEMYEREGSGWNTLIPMYGKASTETLKSPLHHYFDIKTVLGLFDSKSPRTV